MSTKINELCSKCKQIKPSNFKILDKDDARGLVCLECRKKWHFTQRWHTIPEPKTTLTHYLQVHIDYGFKSYEDYCIGASHNCWRCNRPVHANTWPDLVCSECHSL